MKSGQTRHRKVAVDSSMYREFVGWGESGILYKVNAYISS